MSKNIQKTAKRAKKGKDDSRHRVRTIILSVVIGLFLVYDLSGIGGNIRFYTKWITCGQKPVRSGIMFVGLVPHYEESPVFSMMCLSPPLFCSPIDAERAGYSANIERYEFPHLKAAGEFHGRPMIDHDTTNSEQNHALKTTLVGLIIATTLAIGVGRLYHAKKHSKNR